MAWSGCTVVGRTETEEFMTGILSRRGSIRARRYLGVRFKGVWAAAQRLNRQSELR
jgi:hypothetical protein